MAVSSVELLQKETPPAKAGFVYEEGLKKLNFVISLFDFR